MTALRDMLLLRIAHTGPIRLSEYMNEALLHPQLGYYTTRAPFGVAGDFTTAPEISQMFGEMIGLCFADYWLRCDKPRFTLIELGPGRGTLMADILRATKQIRDFHRAMKVMMIEASPALQRQQEQALAGYDVAWQSTLPRDLDGPVLLIANEFFDALPIRQFQRKGAAWAETMVGAQNGALCFGRAEPVRLAALDPYLSDTQDGDIIETCPLGTIIAQQIGAHIAQSGGLALFIDYGAWRGRGDTFQAMRAHGFTDPLAAPGKADVTAHVDFERLAHASPSAHLYTTQGDFLRALGIDLRSQALGAQLSGEALARHLGATRRLTNEAEMGQLFKVLALYAANAPKPAGF